MSLPVIRTGILSFLGLLLTACATPGNQATQKDGIAFVDLTDDFARAYDAASDLPPDMQAKAVKTAMQAAIADYYSAEWRDVPEADVDAWFAEYLSVYPKQRAEIARVSGRFNSMMTAGTADFERRIGPLPDNFPVYLIVSMGEFDGATRELDGRLYLMFGADVIADIHQHNDPRPLVQHELFHIYHSQRFASCDEIWCSLWMEGLATYVAQSLNPNASDAELGLTVPEPIRPALEAHREEALCAALERLDSTEQSDHAALFSFARLSENLPPRFGYLVGAWVARDLGKTRSLSELAELTGPDLRGQIEYSLRGMASCQ